MITSLASYPRSGSTLLRQVLKQVFEQETYTDSNEPKGLGINQSRHPIAGHHFGAGYLLNASEIRHHGRPIR